MTHHTDIHRMDPLYCNQKTPFSKEFLQNQHDPFHFAFYRRVRSELKNENAYQKARRVLVAVSGGVDSCVLLHELVCYAHREGGPEIKVAHIHHGVRDMADRDQSVALDQAKRHGVGFISTKLKGLAHTSEEHLRNARLDALAQLAEREACDLVVLGQHKQDQAETFLLRLLRGADVLGLSGIKTLRDQLWFRPMLWASKQEITEEARHRGIYYIEDETNRDTSYRRNYVRHVLIPDLQSLINPQVVHHFCDLTQSFSELQSFLQEHLQVVLNEVTNGPHSIDMAKLRDEHIVMRKQVYIHMHKDLCAATHSLEKTHIDALDHMLFSKQMPKEMQLPGGVGVAFGEGVLMFLKT